MSVIPHLEEHWDEPGTTPDGVNGVVRSLGKTERDVDGKPLPDYTEQLSEAEREQRRILGELLDALRIEAMERE